MSTGTGERTRTVLSCLERVEELLVMGLRLREGIDIARLETLAGGSLEQLLDLRAVELLIGEGWLTRDDGRIAATAAGRQRLEGILPMLLAEGAPATDWC